MAIWQSLKLFWKDLLCELQTQKYRAVFYCLCVVGGLVCGFVVYSNDPACWWGINRYEFACKLIYGGFFAVLFAEIFAALIFATAITFSCIKYCALLRAVALFVGALYWGGILAAIAQISAVFCVLYLLLCALVQLAIFFVAAFDLSCRQTANCLLADAFETAKNAYLMFAAEVILKLLLLFLILRPVTASI